MTDDNARAAVAQEYQAALRFRESAEHIAAVREYEAAANRLYLAALHAARAVCLTRGLEPKRHRGLKHLLALHFVATGELPDWVVSTLGQLETERDLADYGPGYTVSEARYGERRDACDQLLAELRRYLETGNWFSRD